jgi:multiple sugar transport system permease protein
VIGGLAGGPVGGELAEEELERDAGADGRQRSSARRRGARSPLRDGKAAALFMSPWAIGLLGLVTLPIVLAVYWSFTNYNLLTPPSWVGLSNYTTLFADPVFLQAVRNTLFLTVVGVVAGTLMGLGTAVLLNRQDRLTRSFRTVVFMPAVVPPVATAIVWIFILNPQYGLLNDLLAHVGVHEIGWLDDPRFARYALLMMVLWGAIGQIMITFLAALQEIPGELTEAAAVDGAGRWAAFRRITLPLLRPVILYNVVIAMLFYFQFFEQAFVVSPNDLGAPVNSTLTYSLYIYEQAFSFLHMGEAAAMSVMLLMASGIVTALFFWVSRKLDA